MIAQRRVLLVASSYEPAMIADMQRARMLAWELPRLGWEVEVLAPESAFQHPCYLDNDSKAFFPPDTVVHRVRQWIPDFFAKLGMRTIGWRAWVPMRSRGLELLKTGRFDLVYFTTTQFCLFLLGPYWRKQTNVPYVLDFHDPCYQEQKGTIASTRHPFKREITRRLMKHIESKSVLKASALVSVSPSYLETLKARYALHHPAWLQKQLYRTIPFAARESDLLEVQKSLLPSQVPTSENLRLVYVGAGGGIMRSAFKLICRGLAFLREQDDPLVNRVRMELYGTTFGWREGDAKHLEEVANEIGVGDLVKEYPQRVSYRGSLELLLESDGAFILGVNDPGYMPSKLFSYALSGRPLLASLRRESPAYVEFQNPGLGHVLWFDAQNEMALPDVGREIAAYLAEAAARKIFHRCALLEPHLAPAMARQHAELFEACMEKNQDSI